VKLYCLVGSVLSSNQFISYDGVFHTLLEVFSYWKQFQYIFFTGDLEHANLRVLSAP
jgi:hypothetical protein